MPTLGETIDALQRLKNQRKDLQGQVDELDSRIELAETALLAAMDAQGVQRLSGSLASASVTESVKPSVQDWDAFYKYIRKHGYFHLLDRRPSVAGCRELFENHGAIPGVVPFVKRVVRTTSL